jgi:hypothetical protein
MSRSATEEIVLDNIYQLAGIAPPSHANESEYSGHPLAARHTGADWMFYVLWPVVVALAGWVHFRDRSRT